MDLLQKILKKLFVNNNKLQINLWKNNLKKGF